MSDKIKVFALGGLDESGRDCYIVEINEDIFVLDAGISLPDKTFLGVDCIIPNFDYLIKNKNRIRAYIMTHGHDESVGALKFVYRKAPAKIYCTASTRAVMLGQLFIHHYENVPFDFEVVNPSDKRVIAGRNVTFFQTCHNAANSFGVAISTDQGNIVFTSDYIINFATDELNYRFDLAAASELAKEQTFLLMAESKSAGITGYCSPKHRISDRIEKYFKSGKRIYIVCYWQNMYRLREIARLIRKYNKKLFCYDKYTEEVLRSIVMEGNGVQLTNDDILKREDLLRVRKSDLVILMVGHSDDIFDEISSLSMGRNADSRLVVEPTDVFINVAVPRPSYETAATRSMDNVYRTGCEVVWLKGKDVSAMHACEDDLRFMLNMFRPKYYWPVRGNYTNIMENAKLSLALGIGLNHMNVFVLDNGMQLIFEKDKRPVILPNEVTGVDITPMLVDGKGVAKKSDEAVEIRNKLAVDGAVIIASTVSLKENKIVAGPDCQMRGFVFSREAEPLLKSVSQIYVEEVTAALRNGNSDFEDTKMLIKERVRKFIRRENGREPFVDPIIIISEE
ncbi:MAG: ribonuclease J [Bacilli bacterium]|nr:ribonuclease J [Bacilli bacterium]